MKHLSSDPKRGDVPAGPLRVSSQLVQLAGGAVAHAKVGVPVPFNEDAWELLEQFRAPVTPDAVLERLALPVDTRAAVEAAIGRFIEAGLLVEPDEAAYLHRHFVGLTTPHRPRFLPAPRGFLAAGSETGAADFQVLGAPLDRAAHVPGAARGPSAVREASNSLPAYLDARTAAFRGLWDHAACRRVLEGARFVDHGDVALDGAASLAENFDAIHAAVAHVLGASPAIPVTLGGDHSVTEPVLRALTEARGPVFLVHFDAHTDMSPAYEGRPHHHGSVMDRVRRMDAVAGILQVGVRDLGPPWWKGVEKTEVVSTAEARRTTPEALVAKIPEGVACYVSIDVDVLDPSEAPGTGVPVPDGLRLAELVAFVQAVGAARTVAGVDLVEVAPELDRGRLTAQCAVRTLIALLDAVRGRRATLERVIRDELAAAGIGRLPPPVPRR
jgi:agmatinase